MEFVAQTADGTVRYSDRKRYMWLAALTSPCIAPLTIWVYFVSGGSAWGAFLPLAYFFVWIPTLDELLGEDSNNPPEAIAAAMARDNYYRWLLYVDIAFLYGAFFCFAWLAGTQHLPWWALVALALGAGIAVADVIFIGHELGHKKSKLDRAMAQIALSLVGYGHFTIEHNRGHHVQVATPDDSASSRMGENVYKFALREIPGALTRSWRLEWARLAQEGHAGVWWRNRILRSWTLTTAIAAGLIAAFGWVMVPFLLIHHLYAWFGLTQANYIEHYGLLREKLPNGRYELPQPKHSWNTNHIYSNLLTLHLQRHSDHHANALRPFQALRNFDDAPRLPSGYPGCFGLVAIPKLWFKVMDAKVLEWANGDLSKINIDPDRKIEIYVRYGVSLPDDVFEAVTKPARPRPKPAETDRYSGHELELDRPVNESQDVAPALLRAEDRPRADSRAA
ncbi:MAG TPA: alkane 1-monooxygenase [Steroidobacteraceae bacterium]|nr:alkane 1-monooxygenase [Steroidobacteraceae bacterium]